MRTQAIPMEQLAQLLELQLAEGEAPLRVTGSSMHPTLRDRLDTVYLKQADGRVGKGDVILYRRENGSYILHRVVKCTAEGFLCAGDNQYQKEAVAPQQVLAVVTAFQRGAKWVDVSHRGYRLYVWLGIALFPLRRPWLALRRRLGALRRKRKKSRG